MAVRLAIIGGTVPGLARGLTGGGGSMSAAPIRDLPAPVPAVIHACSADLP